MKNIIKIDKLGNNWSIGQNNSKKLYPIALFLAQHGNDSNWQHKLKKVPSNQDFGPDEVLLESDITEDRFSPTKNQVILPTCKIELLVSQWQALNIHTNNSFILSEEMGDYLLEGYVDGYTDVSSEDLETIEKNTTHEELDTDVEQVIILKRHSYPWYIKMPLWLILILAILGITNFVRVDMLGHRVLNGLVQEAEQLFDEQEFGKAYKKFLFLANIYPRFKKGKIRLAQICFLCAEKKKDFYFKAIEHLHGLKFERTERAELRSYLPEAFREEFNDFLVGKNA